MSNTLKNSSGCINNSTVQDGTAVKSKGVNTPAAKPTGTSGIKPAHGTGEWASHNYNIQSGCRSGCKYCYAQCMAIRFGRHTPASWLTPEIIPSKVDQRVGRKTGRIMFPTSHDIDPSNMDECLTALVTMLAAGNDVLIVSKPHLECVKRLCRELQAYKRQITFRFTIGSACTATLKSWEPYAPPFSERLASLRHAFKAGYRPASVVSRCWTGTSTKSFGGQSRM